MGDRKSGFKADAAAIHPKEGKGSRPANRNCKNPFTQISVWVGSSDAAEPVLNAAKGHSLRKSCIGYVVLHSDDTTSHWIEPTNHQRAP